MIVLAHARFFFRQTQTFSFCTPIDWVCSCPRVIFIMFVARHDMFNAHASEDGMHVCNHMCVQHTKSQGKSYTRENLPHERCSHKNCSHDNFSYENFTRAASLFRRETGLPVRQFSYENFSRQVYTFCLLQFYTFSLLHFFSARVNFSYEKFSYENGRTGCSVSRTRDLHARE